MLKFKSNVLKIIMIMLIVCTLLIPTVAFATDDVIEIKPTTTTPTPSASATPSSAPTSTPTATTTKTPSTPTKLPQTGIEDYTSLIVVTILLAGSAIFAYIKIKEYNKF